MAPVVVLIAVIDPLAGPEVTTTEEGSNPSTEVSLAKTSIVVPPLPDVAVSSVAVGSPNRSGRVLP